ncbi:Expansin-like B1 [Abeliophyllum distichum]|uniref:Expansin-like B1 n=1 Tax=Abeliophyllum distichum TaxID=126358 RepID=A0ABD1UJT6_9LAMI
MGSYFLFFPFILLLAAIGYGQGAYASSRATYYGSPDCKGTPTGACGYGEYGRTVNNGEVTGVSRLYRNGSGCGACYQVRCQIRTHCREEGVKVVVTDYGEGDRTDFILSTQGYSKLARPNMAEELFAYGVVDVEYNRVPCRYGRRLMLKVHEYSNYPHYLALVPLYNEGFSDITAMYIWQDGMGWRPMRRAFGTVFDIPNPPKEPLLIRVQYNVQTEVKSADITNAIPEDWEVGVAYDTHVQIN